MRARSRMVLAVALKPFAAIQSAIARSISACVLGFRSPLYRLAAMAAHISSQKANRGRPPLIHRGGAKDRFRGLINRSKSILSDLEFSLDIRLGNCPMLVARARSWRIAPNTRDLYEPRHLCGCCLDTACHASADDRECLIIAGNGTDLLDKPAKMILYRFLQVANSHPDRRPDRSRPCAEFWL